ncbi:nucleoside deaminase [Paenibacillus sp. FSL R7-0048]|uniref:nucleoside deaminase n=1 Tax=Paenibacillus TaxID=44249 RepID=UPI00096E9577|nr:nucleoside deaminase [Paenibacillus odorifer]OMD67409.1 hypothetical protein BSK48_20130 [Paenibacillus odorifer]OMD78619.1 hypothetical protein BSK53_23380 [Paenibacillus odorifer]
MKKYDEDFMRLAVASARDGIERLEFPFGCCIAQDRNRYVFAGNHSLKSGDPTSHAEINTIREWSQRYGAASLKETVIYTTSEPCLMCLGAINWAQIPRVVFGTSLNRCIHHGFSEANIDSAVLTASFPHPVSMEGGILEQECEQLFTLWNKKRRFVDLFSRPYTGERRHERRK